jgi:negative regulator of flagellin synthesis FlgM
LSDVPLTGFEDWKEADVSHKINELNAGAQGAAASVGTARSAAGSAGSAPAGAGPASDAEVSGTSQDVHITDTAARLALLEPALREAPAVDASRVAAIRSAIEAGTYKMQPEHVATGLLQVEQALSGLHGGPVAPLAIPGTTDEP